MNLEKKKFKLSLKTRWPSLILILLTIAVAIGIETFSRTNPEQETLKLLKAKYWRILEHNPCNMAQTPKSGFYRAYDSNGAKEFYLDSYGRIWAKRESDLENPNCQSIQEPSFIEELSDEI